MTSKYGTCNPIRLSDEDKKWVHDELQRLRREHKARLREKRNKTRKILTRRWRSVDWSKAK